MRAELALASRWVDSAGDRIATPIAAVDRGARRRNKSQSLTIHQLNLAENMI
jgi:hypothetical protein